MLSKRDAQFGRGRPVAPDTFIRGNDAKAHLHYYCDLAGLATLFAGRYVKNDAINSAVETLTTLSTEPWTLRRVIDRMGLGSRNPAIVGSAEEVADDLIAWVEETDIDGFHLSRIVTPESLEDFVDLIVPILQERGAYKRDYLPGTLREKLFGRSRLLPPSHPAAAHRQPATSGRESG
jgi:alkanesulfonate monooxygenase SsuD/methylene tetrahydromethanopterin reductase-like flavin-dependent oxidoreductase (luciferase family)